MYKKYKIYFSVILILIFTFLYFGYRNETYQSSNVFTASTDNENLIIDTLDYKILPKNFRKCSNLINTGNAKNLNLAGLDKLNISGSAQFSEYNLPLLINKIGTSFPISVIDLREESHGFINGIPVSWSNLKNNANMGLTKEEVLSTEGNKLGSVKLNVPISFYNHPEINITPTKVQNESQLVNYTSLSYTRIPVTDGKIPTDDMVDYFVEFVKSQPKNTWMHIHCKEGIGRTTIYMIMYDMMKNYSEVTSDDIIKRQLFLAGFNEQPIEAFYKSEKATFLKNFYKYCEDSGNEFNIKWSSWKGK